jgi:hypothetical protein
MEIIEFQYVTTGIYSLAMEMLKFIFHRNIMNKIINTVGTG